MPFSKPPIVQDGNALRILNVPTIHPRVLFAQQSIADLPFLEYDAGYSPRQWQPTFADVSYVKRLLSGATRPPRPKPEPHGSDEALVRVNAAILREFIRLAGDNDVIPLIAYFPGREDILRLSRGEQAVGQSIMKEMGIPFIDTTPCVLKVGPDAGYVPNDTHYSPAGNAAVEKCLGPVVDGILAEDKD